MTSTPQVSKKQLLEVKILKNLCQNNFSNRLLFLLSGLEDIATQPDYQKYAHWIDFVYQEIKPELIQNKTQPSKGLADFVFQDSLRYKDYENLVQFSKTASIKELKEFLNIELDFKPKEKIVDYLTFPLLTMMGQHLNSSKKSEFLLSYPELIKKCFKETREKTIKELLSPTDRKNMSFNAPDDLKSFLTVDENKISPSWEVHFSAGRAGGYLDLRLVQAQGRWPDVKKAREKEKQTGIPLKIQQWHNRHSLDLNRLMPVKTR